MYEAGGGVVSVSMYGVRIGIRKASGQDGSGESMVGSGDMRE